MFTDYFLNLYIDFQIRIHITITVLQFLFQVIF